MKKNRKQRIKQMGLERQPGARELSTVMSLEGCFWRKKKKIKLSQRCAKPPAFDLGGSKWDTTSGAERSCCSAQGKGRPS